MAYRSAPLYEDVIWRTHLQPQDAGLAQAVRVTIAEHREHLLEFIRLDEPAPLNAMTLAQWSSPNALSSLLAVYSDHIYRNQPLMIRENKPLISLWAQWYIGLMVPPLMLALLTKMLSGERISSRRMLGLHKPCGRRSPNIVNICWSLSAWMNPPHLTP